MDLSPEEIRGALDATLARPEWLQSVRLSRFLRFVVVQTLAGDGPSLKETVVGVGVFDRPADYDPKTDPIVRVEARRLRLKLQEYYAGAGAQDRVRFLLPKGTYQPQFESSAPVAERPSLARWRSAAAAVVAAAAIAMGVSLASRGFPAKPVSSATPRLLTGNQGYNRGPSFSPDAKWIAFSRNLDVNRANLYVQPVAQGEARRFTDRESFDHEPVWSPDGLSIAFLREMDRSRFAVIVRAVDGGGERRVAEVAVRSPIDWATDGKSIVAADRDDPSSPYAIFRIDAGDGRKQQLTSPPKGTPGDSIPRVSPDGKSIAFVRSAEASVQDIFVAPVAGGEVRRVTWENRVVEGIAWHPSGPHVIASMQRGGELRSLWRVFLDGRGPERVPEAGIGPVSPAISRRGDMLAYVTRFSDTNLWGGRIESGKIAGARAISHSIQLDTSPQLSPDGQWIAWRSTSSGTNEVWIARADGTGTRQLTHMNGPTTGSANWSPDGTWIVFDSRPNGNGDVFRIPAAGGAPVALTRAASNEVLPSFSRDNQWIYYSTDAAGLWEVWRMTAEGKNPQRVAGHGAFNAKESPDGKWLYYTRQGGAESGIWRIPVGSGPEEKLTAELTPNFWGQWAVSRHAVFFAVFPPAGTRRAISRLELATGKLTDIHTLAKMPVQFDSGMAVAADESYIYWSQLDQAGSDVFLVAGFR